MVLNDRLLVVRENATQSKQIAIDSGVGATIAGDVMSLGQNTARGGWRALVRGGAAEFVSE